MPFYIYLLAESSLHSTSSAVQGKRINQRPQSSLRKSLFSASLLYTWEKSSSTSGLEITFSHFQYTAEGR